MPITNSSAIPLRPDLRVVAGLVPPGARVLDLGCGDGALLEHLKLEKGVQGRGIERSEAGVLACVRRGLSVRQGNLQEGLADYPDKNFDVVILSQTLQFLNDPMMILGEMLRVGRLAVVSFPNWGYWRCRLHLLARRADTPRTRLPAGLARYAAPTAFTVADFTAFCRERDIEVAARDLSFRRAPYRALAQPARANGHFRPGAVDQKTVRFAENLSGLSQFRP